MEPTFLYDRFKWLFVAVLQITANGSAQYPLDLCFTYDSLRLLFTVVMWYFSCKWEQIFEISGYDICSCNLQLSAVQQVTADGRRWFQMEQTLFHLSGITCGGSLL